jgi:hypothetical protein
MRSRTPLGWDSGHGIPCVARSRRTGSVLSTGYPREMAFAVCSLILPELGWAPGPLFLFTLLAGLVGFSWLPVMHHALFNLNMFEFFLRVPRS